MYFKRINELREDNDLTIKYISEYLDINRDVYSRYEKGVRDIPIWALIKLSGLYNVSVDYILGLTDDSSRHA